MPVQNPILRRKIKQKKNPLFPGMQRKGLIPGLLGNNIRQQIAEQGKRMNWNKTASELIKGIQNRPRQFNEPLNLMRAFQNYERLSREQKIALDGFLSNQMKGLGIEAHQARIFESMKSKEAQKRIKIELNNILKEHRIEKKNIDVQGIAWKINEVLSKKGIPPQAIQQITEVYLSFLNGEISSTVFFKQLIQERNGKLFFMIQEQAIPAELFLGKKDIAFINDYGEALKRAENNITQGYQRKLLKAA
ncbi:MAG: hypothetical protein JW703_04690 [Candidatus Diapherotrites archaeon]|nr:hypothetical protein [Candidatus Diapherotrites archaeon]